MQEIIKTMEDWEEQAEKRAKEQSDSRKGQYSWMDYAKPGDLVDETIFDYFLNVMPPVAIAFGFLQVGEPYSSRKNEDTGRYEDTYLTFTPAGKGIYRYCGTCFYKQTKNIN